jgi:ABC-type nitrate/sulfonate/bicarbonate transport system substrate-binding protein
MTILAKRIAVGLLCAVLVIGFGGCFKTQKGTAPETSLPVLRVAHQPVLHGLPTYMAIQRGWDKEVGLRLEFQPYASGPPMNEALASGQWDVGAMGPVPAMLAGIRYGAYTIGIGNEEGECHRLFVRSGSPILAVKGYNPKYPSIYGSPDTVKGRTILLTTGSTGQQFVIAYLRALGLSESDVKMAHMEQAQALAAFEAKQGDIVQLWAPFIYTAESRGWVSIATGTSVGVEVPCPLVASQKAMDEHPELVAKWLMVYLRGIREIKAKPDEARDLMARYYKEFGIELDAQVIGEDIRRRKLFDTEEQLALFSKDPATGRSRVDEWFVAALDAFVEQGRLPRQDRDKFLASGLVTDRILKMVAEMEAKPK